MASPLQTESVAFLLVVMVVACTQDPSAGTARADLVGRNTCEHNEAGSRWNAPQDGAYHADGEYGSKPGQELIDLWGTAAAPSGELLVWDAGRTMIIRLDSDLRELGRYGRAGRGPGELTYQRIGAGNWIAADDAGFVVMDLRSISEFDRTGTFRRHATQNPPFPVDIMRIEIVDGRVVYAVNVIDRNTGARAVETWELQDSGPHTLLRVDSMPALPRWRGSLVRGGFVDQAEPLWALSGGCAFLSDGAGDWIVRADLAGSRTDTIHLPARPIPERTVQDERDMERLRRTAASVGISAGSASTQPTARLKWNAMIVDPDGYIWLEPWRPASMQHQPLTVWVVNPSSGAVDSLQVPMFPRAFMADRAFAALAYERESGAYRVIRYSQMAATQANAS